MSENKTEYIHMLIPKDMKKRLKEVAVQEETTVTAIVLELIEKRLKNPAKNPVK